MCLGSKLLLVLFLWHFRCFRFVHGDGLEEAGLVSVGAVLSSSPGSVVETAGSGSVSPSDAPLEPPSYSLPESLVVDPVAGDVDVTVAGAAAAATGAPPDDTAVPGEDIEGPGIGYAVFFL
jgi:hypothetical protein